METTRDPEADEDEGRFREGPGKPVQRDRDQKSPTGVFGKHKPVEKPE